VLGDAFPINAYVPKLFSKVGSVAYFSAYGPDVDGSELWRTDGTEAGTYMVKDIYPHQCCNGESTPYGMTDAYGVVFFNASDGVAGRELWTTDGTEAGTTMVLDFFPGPGHSSPSWFTPMNGRLFFVADDGIHGRELWALVPESIPTISGMQVLVLMGCLAVAGVMLIRRLKLGTKRVAFDLAVTWALQKSDTLADK
jgi:ELWxxDGT repeat protein